LGKKLEAGIGLVNALNSDARCPPPAAVTAASVLTHYLAAADAARHHDARVHNKHWSLGFNGFDHHPCSCRYPLP